MPYNSSEHVAGGALCPFRHAGRLMLIKTLCFIFVCFLGNKHKNTEFA